jgi:uncharacterized membrane protein
VLKPKAERGAERTVPRDTAWSPPDIVTTAATIGGVAAGVALFEAALIPGIVIGGAALLAPRYLRGSRWNPRRLFNTADRRRAPPADPAPRPPVVSLAEFPLKRAVAKTITFRTRATAMDFTVNYVVVGDFAQAVALSAFGFVAGTFVYLAHEMVWDRYDRPPQPAPSRHLLPAPG